MEDELPVLRRPHQRGSIAEVAHDQFGNRVHERRSLRRITRENAYLSAQPQQAPRHMAADAGG